MDFKIHRASLLGAVGAGMLAALFLGGCGKKTQELSTVIKDTAISQQKNIPRPESASLGGEWTVLSLSRSGEDVPDSYWQIYQSNLEKRLKENNGVLSEQKYTEYFRVVLTLASLGEDSEDFAGYNLLDPLTDTETVISQGINGAVYALLALDAGEYAALEMEDEIAETRKELKEYLIARELPEGGFALDEEEVRQADADITAMVLQCLAPYREEAEVEAVIARGIKVLVDAQSEDGSYSSIGEESSEALAQIILALSTLEIDCNTDERFVKKEKGLYELLLNYYDGKGGFSHTKDGKADPMATDQALCALVAYERFLKGQNDFYQMDDHR